MKTFLIALLAIFVMVFLAGALWITSSFFGNPASAWMARQQIERYLAETYPEKQFAIQDIQYDFKFARYQAQVIEGGENAFRIYANQHGVEYDEYRYRFAMDQVLTERFNQQFERALGELLMAQFPQLHAVGADLYVARGVYPPDTQFAAGMERESRLELYLVGEDLPVESFTRQCTEIRDVLLRAGYQPKTLRFLYNQPEDSDGKGGMLYYALTIQREAYHVSPALLQADVESFNQIHRGRQAE